MFKSILKNLKRFNVNLCKKVGGVLHGVSGEDGTKIQFPNFGNVYIIKGLTYFEQMGILADRNMVLMMKDITNSRFQCLMSLQNRIDGKYGDQCIKDLEEVYSIGDQMIIQSGNRAYDGIKMVEPLCNLRLIELAQLERPRIPLFGEFRTHLEKKVEEDTQNHKHLERLFHKITSLGDVDTLLVIYGSYRHWGHPFLEYLEGLKKLH